VKRPAVGNHIWVVIGLLSQAPEYGPNALTSQSANGQPVSRGALDENGASVCFRNTNWDLVLHPGPQLCNTKTGATSRSSRQSTQRHSGVMKWRAAYQFS